MALYMKYGSIKGAVTTDGFKDWIELDSFQWGVARAVGTAARSSTSREHSEPSLSEVTVTKRSDVASPKLFLDAVAGKLDNKVEIKYEEVFAAAKQRLDAQFRMYSPQPLSDEQLGQYTVQYLQNKDEANKIFEEVKALKVLDHLKSIVTLDQKEVSDKDFKELLDK